MAMMTAPSMRVAMATAMRLAGDKEGRARLARAMVPAMRAAGDKEGEGCKGNGNCNKGGRRAMAMATKRMMAMATRVAGDKEGNGYGCKSDGDGNKGGR
jgi:hypothetical protein